MSFRLTIQRIRHYTNRHSSWGVEYASYKFDTPGIIVPKVTIDAILFQPVEPVEYNFKMSVKV
jgi:hypothetical protein